MEEQKSNRIKKAIAILLVVLFVATATAGAVSAYNGNDVKGIKITSAELTSIPAPAVSPNGGGHGWGWGGWGGYKY